MTLETIKNNIDNKIKRQYLEEKKTIPEIIDNFKFTIQVMKAGFDNSNSTRETMLKMYVEQAEKRVIQLNFIDDAYKKLNIENDREGEGKLEKTSR